MMKATMADPRDFLPSKYQSSIATSGRQKQSDDSIDSPWSALTEETSGGPNTMRSAAMKRLESTRSSQLVASPTTTSETTPELSSRLPANLRSKSTKNKLMAALVVILLIVGVASSAFLVQQSQDVRQQASGTYNSGPCGDNDRPSTCNGSCSPVKAHSGQSFACKWINNECKESAQPCSSSGSGDERIEMINRVPVLVDLNTSAKCSGKGYWCDGCDGFCLSGTYTGGGCISAQMAKCGEGHTYGAACSTTSQSGWKHCSCGGENVWFNVHPSTSYCNCPPGGHCNDDAASSGTNMGLCGIYLNSTEPGSACTVGEEGGGGSNNYSECFTCNNNGCSVTNNSANCSTCWVGHYVCEGTSQNISCEPRSDNIISKKEGLSSSSFNLECGTVEQIDVACGGGYVNSRTRLNPPCTTTEPPTITTQPPTVTTQPPEEEFTCVDIEMLDSGNMVLSGEDDEDLREGDMIRFRASSSNDSDSRITFEFRILPPNTDNWISLNPANANASNKNTSAPYTIISSGDHTAQARICVDGVCQAWETIRNLDNREETSTREYCISSANCAANEYCYQPPMPECPEGMACTQVMPRSYCMPGTPGEDQGSERR